MGVYANNLMRIGALTYAQPVYVMSASYIADRVELDGGTVDREILTAEYNSLPEFLRENATMFGVIPTAKKTTKYYTFDVNAGNIVAVNFTRATRAVYMEKDDALDEVMPHIPVFEYEETLTATINALYNSAISDPTAIQMVNYLPNGYVTDGSVDYTSAYASAIGQGANKVVIMPNFPIMVNGTTFYPLRSNCTLIFQPNSWLYKSPGTANTNYKILMCRTSQNSTIINPRIRGDVGHGSASTVSYEFGLGIDAAATTNLTIYNPYVTLCQGDGIYGGPYAGAATTNLKIYRDYLTKNGRNNVSLTAGVGAYFHESIWEEANKSNPVAGMDIESDSSLFDLTDIILRNPITCKNWWAGIQISMGLSYSEPTRTIPFNVTIVNHFSYGGWVSNKLSVEDKQSAGILFGVINHINPSWNAMDVYSPPPGGGPATFADYPQGPPFQDGDKRIIYNLLGEENMTLRITTPRIFVNGVRYNTTKLNEFFNTSGLFHMYGSVKEIILE